jgi:hypothetical protein
MSGLVFVGYTYLRNRHARQVAAATPAAPPSSSKQPLGPHKAEILVDDAMLDGDYSIIGGTVRNISTETLTALTVNMELKHRKDGASQNTAVQLSPNQLAPQQEGHYSLRIKSADYNAARLVSLSTGADAMLLAYGTSPGKKRTPEKLEAKTIYVNRPAPAKGEFINTPDTPVRVP